MKTGGAWGGPATERWVWPRSAVDPLLDLLNEPAAPRRLLVDGARKQPWTGQRHQIHLQHKSLIEPAQQGAIAPKAMPTRRARHRSQPGRSIVTGGLPVVAAHATAAT